MEDRRTSFEPQFAADPEAERLAQALALADGFQLALVYCGSAELAAKLASWLERRIATLREAAPERFVQLTVSPDWQQSLSLAQLVDQVLAPLLSARDSGAAAPVFVNTAVIDARNDSVWRAFLGRVNERRNVIQRQLRSPLVWVLPERFAAVLPVNAPDLWSIRTVEAHIDSGRLTDLANEAE